MDFNRSHDGLAPGAGITSARRRDRDISELIGIVRGLLADGLFVQAEADFLSRWLAEKAHHDYYPFNVIHQRLEEALMDGVLDDEESRDLSELLLQLCSNENASVDAVVVGRAATSLPLTDPAPPVYFDRRVFVVTGVFDFGGRKQVIAEIERRGGRVSKAVSGATDYLVIGNQGSDDWAHSAFGRKIQEAMELRSQGKGNAAIISEPHWAAHL